MYNIVIKIGYDEYIKVSCVELIDIMQILPVIQKMKFVDHGEEKDLIVSLEPVKMKLVKDGENGGIEECL